MTAGFGANQEPLADAAGSERSRDREGAVTGYRKKPDGQKTSTRASIWILFLPLVSLTAVIAAQPQWRLFTPILSASSYSLMYYLLPECRFRKDRYLCPLNWAMMLFLLKLVIVPALLMWMGPSLGTMDSLPAAPAMERAMLLETAGFVAFCLALRFVGSKLLPMPHLEGVPSRALIVGFAAAGAIGFFLTFGSVGALMEYFSNPAIMGDMSDQAQGALRPLLGTILRPFIAFALILFWSRTVERKQTPQFRLIALTILVAAGIIAANLTYSFNRGAFVFPLMALTAVFISHLRPIPPYVLAGMAMLVAVPILFIGSYRANPNSASDDSMSAKDLPDQIQVYANAPQFMGGFLEQTGWGRSLYWGRTLLASALESVPMLGKGYRESSGTYVYNRAIYNDFGYTDQIISLQSELFINFHLPGVVAGLFMLGLVIGELQRRMDAAKSVFGAFSIGYIGFWTSMLVVWSLSVLAQILIYFCWPIYTYIACKCFVGQASACGGLQPAPRLQPL